MSKRSDALQRRLDARVEALRALRRVLASRPPGPDLRAALHADRPPALDLLPARPGGGLDNGMGEAASMQGRQGATGGKDTCAGDEP